MVPAPPGYDGIMQIPMVDLHAQYLEIKEEIDAAIAEVIQNSAFIKGPFVERFEVAFAQFLGVEHCIGVGNGTDALVIALKALGIGPGDEVITAVNTFVATPEAISLTGARPVFCDVEPGSMLLDPDLIKERLTEQTRAIIPVHLYGRVAAMDRILDVARQHQLKVVEDAAQAHGAQVGGVTAGAFGDASTHSFFPGKNLGAYGDAGAIVTCNEEAALFARQYANHGRSTKYGHQFEGMNSRLDGLQAAVLSVKLRYLERWCELRREHARTYTRLLQGIEGITCPEMPEAEQHVFHLYVIRTPYRDALREHLASKGINTGIHYPQIMAELPAYRKNAGPPEDYPVAAALSSEILSLPLYPEMTAEQIEIVVAEIRLFCR